MIQTCKSSFHPSSFKRAFLDISNMAHMATSAALPCQIQLNESSERQRERERESGGGGRTCTGVFMAARSMWPLWEAVAWCTEGKDRARPSNVQTYFKVVASFLRFSCQASTSFLSLYQRSTVSLASLTDTWE